MITTKSQRIRYIVGDFLTTSLAWFVLNIIRYTQILIPYGETYPSFQVFYTTKTVILGQVLLPMMMMGLYTLSGYYNRPLFRSRLDELLTTITTAFIGSVVIFFITLVDDPIPDRASNLELLGMLFALLFGLVYLTRVIITTYGRTKINRGKLIYPMLIIGMNSEARRLRHRMENNRGRGYKIIAYVDPDEDYTNDNQRTFDGLPIIRFDQLEDYKEQYSIKALLITEGVSAGKTADFSTVLNRLYPLDISILVYPKSLQLATRLQKLGDIAGEPLINICSASMKESTQNLKRAGDILVASLALILLSPVYLLLAILIKRDSEGPVFYFQERIGYHKKPFKIIKFRTMVNNAESDGGPQLSSEGDARITNLGRFMRKYRLDELPQFWNVLRGEMSLVGPRPEREFFIRQILKKAPYYSLLHQVRPGITSWGMVKHGYASTVDEMVERAQFDLIYLENISLIVDLKILLHTVNTVIKGRGV